VSDSEHRSEEPFDTYLDLSVLVGIRADTTVVHREGDTFTVDFIREVRAPGERILVARTLLSPSVALVLRDQVDRTWRAYSEWSMPEEGDRWSCACHAVES
jgi:hypothetical protein